MSTAETVELAGRRAHPLFPLALRLAFRELRSGLRGFHVFVACVALGVMAITAVGAFSDALRSGFERQGEAILGGDATLARMHARAEPRERTWLEQQGRLSESATLRTMARLPDGSDQALAELKAVDGVYPLVGGVRLSGGQTLDQAVRAGAGAAVEPILLERLGLKVGDTIRIGHADVDIRATIVSEPDQLLDRLTYGPRVLVSLETLEKTGLIQPGTLVRWRYAVKLKGGSASTEELPAFRERAKRNLPESGFTITDRRDPSPQLSRSLERLRQFLTLIGLTALLVGGVGVANAVATFIDRRRKVIATFKSLGATSREVLAVFLIQVLAMAMLGIGIGLGVGYLVPTVLNAAYGDLLPIRAEITVSASSLLTAIAYGGLVALLFTLWPLSRAERVSAAVLFRDEAAPEQAWPALRVIGLTVVVVATLVALAVLTSESQRIAAYFCGGVAAVFITFYAVGTAVTSLARRVRRPRMPELALAIGNLGAPGGLTRSVMLSLGAGLSLLVAVALTHASMVAELNERLPESSPNYFVLDIPKTEYPGLQSLVERQLPGSRLEEAPMLRGRLVRLNGKPAEEISAPPEAQWVLSGDRGLTYSETVPEGSQVVKGQWWGKDYQGEPLVSFEAELAKGLGLAIGDTVTVNVLGRNVTARIANLRQVNWESLAINFVMIFSPNTLRGAPHNLLATISLPPGTSLAAEAELARALGRAFPSVTAIRVKDAIAAFNAIFSKVILAVRVAGSVTLAAGALVLAGALATAQRRRILEAVILKVLGATQWRVLTAHFLEYALLATVTAVFAVGLGSAAAWVALTRVMEIAFVFSWSAVAESLALAAGLITMFGGLGTWQVLRSPAVPYLRSE